MGKWIDEIERLEKHSVPELETMAIESDKHKAKDDTLADILYVRQEKLNDAFVFTPENIEKILWIDRQLKDRINKLQQEGERIVRRLEREIKKKNSLFNDYEIMVLVFPKILEWSEEEQSMIEPEDRIHELLECNSHHDTHIEFDPSYKHNCYFDEEKLNWNNMIGARNGEFEGHHIGYAMHELYDHTLWSLPDIVKINEFWYDIRVEYQHY
jgi:hypothetical protein